MDITTTKTFFMWCMILNLGVLFLTSIVCMFFADFSFKMNNRFFGISREAFNILIPCFLGFYKVIVIVFSIVPYIALEIAG